ncbi:MAG: hypothetical protein KGJ98_10110 [Chloroflexota bacterium]|nr:hypothetical protein [Chloroflexota bacterium]
MRTSLIGGLALALAFLLALAPAAVGDSPTEALRAAVAKTAREPSGRIAVSEQASFGGRTLESTASGVLVGGDSDLVVSGEGGGTHRVSVGTTVRERTPDAPTAPWRSRLRPAPTSSLPFALATLADGTSIGDPALYTRVADQGVETLPQGPARKLVGTLDMARLAQAMELGPSDQARMAQWRGTLTVWVAPGGTLARNALHIEMPSASGAPSTLDLSIDLSDLGAPLTVTLP